RQAETLLRRRSRAASSAPLEPSNTLLRPSKIVEQTLSPPGGPMSSRWFPRVVFLVVSQLCAAAASAQVTGSIAGTVRDVSGAVLPGATVTVKGPALQRESVTTITSPEGSYR